MNYVYIKLPRFDGRKTIAFNGLVFIAASGWLAWAHTGGSAGPVGETGLYALAAVALANGVLRVLTSRPVWWRDRIYVLEGKGPLYDWCQISRKDGNVHDWVDDPLESQGDVYHKAAAFVGSSDFTDWNDREQSQDRLQREYTPPRILPYVDFQRDLDRQLCDARAELPLDVEETRN